MTNVDSELGINQGALVGRAQDIDFEASRRKSMAPIEYEVAVYRDGDITIVTFECSAPSRIEEMRKQGIDPENDTIARRSKSRDTLRWMPAIGDPQLCAHLDSR